MTSQRPPIVLIADDEEEMRTMLERFVSSQGYIVHTAADGDEAWEKAQQYRPNLVLLDVRMPGLSGWEVSRNISHNPRLAHTKVIIITGIGETINEMTSPLFGAFSYLDKPFDISDLESKIQAVLGAPPASDSTKKVASPVQGGFAPPRRKPATKKAAAKPAAKKTAAKPATKKAAAKPAAKKTAAKPATKKVAAKPATKKAAAKPATKKTAAKPAAKKIAAKPAAKKTAAKPRKR